MKLFFVLMVIRRDQAAFLIPELVGMEIGHLLVILKTTIWAILGFVAKIAVECVLVRLVVLILHGQDTKEALVG